ncbi:MAG: beta strand repeat-containing protein [Isosphaerales bacterium]
MEGRTLLSAVCWTGRGGDNNWDTPTNWDTDSLPGSADDVTINTSANVVHSAGFTDTINSLTSTQPLSIAGGTLSIASASTIGSTVFIGGTLSGTGTITVSGLLTFNDGTISGSCTVNADGGTSETQNGDITLDGCTFNNPAGQTITSGLWLVVFRDGAVFNNLGTIEASSDEVFEQASGAASSFNNEGTFMADAGNVVFRDDVAQVGVAFNNVGGGSVVVKQGALLLGGGGTSTGGSFTIESGASLQIGQGYANPYTFDAGTTLSGAGSLLVDDYESPVIIAGNSTLTGPADIELGTLQVDGSQPSSAVGVQRYGTLSGTGTVGPITTTNGTISPGDSPTVTGILSAQGNVSLDSGSTFNVALNGATAGTVYDQLNAAGSVNLGGSTLTGSLGFTPAAGETFTIIKSTAPIVGTFKGLPEGASVTIGGVAFRISYAAAGDAVVLTPSIAAPVATKLVVTTEPPSSGAAGSPFSLAVSAEDGSGNVDTSYTGTVVLALASGTGTLGGTTTLNAVNGVATFTGLTLSPAGSYTIGATSGQLIPVTTPRNTIHAAVATKLVVTTEPPSSAAGGSTFSLAVSAEDGSGNVDSIYMGSVVLALAGGTGTLGGTTTLNFVNGVATFAGLTLSSAGIYTIGATNDRLTPATTTQITVSAAAATKLVVTTEPPSSVTAGSPFSLAVSAEDGSGNVDASYTGSVVLALASGTGTLGGTTTLNAVNGVATFAGLTLSLAGSAMIAATSDQLTPATTTQITVNAAAVVDGPKVVSVLRYGYHMMPTTVVLTFDQALNAITAQDDENYRIIGPAGRVIGIKSAVYDPAALTVTLHPRQRINIHHAYKLIVDGTAPRGLTNTLGQLLDGVGDGRPDSNYRTSLTWRNVVFDPPWPKTPRQRGHSY